MSPETVPPETVSHIWKNIRTNPGEFLIRQWNWKSALFSSIIRAAIFLFTNLMAGWRAAVVAMAAEFLFRAVISGFYGTFIQAFRNAQPVWMAMITVLILLPGAAHTLEFAVHVASRTPKLAHSLIASIAFTEIATLFNWYAMRRGALVVGPEASSMADDLRRIPSLIAGFVGSGPIAILRFVRRTQQK